MADRREFLKRMAAVGLTPLAGSIVLTQPFVKDPSGLLTPGTPVDDAVPTETPLIVPSALPEPVRPITAWVNRSEFDLERVPLIGRNSSYEAYAVARDARMRLRLDLEVLSDLSPSEFYSLWVANGAAIKFWIERA